MDGTVTKVNPTAKADGTAIKVCELTFAYTREPVLRGVSFTLEKGAVGLLGPNGSGKTTLLRCLLGQVPLPGRQVSVPGLGHGDRGPAGPRPPGLDARARAGSSRA